MIAQQTMVLVIKSDGISLIHRMFIVEKNSCYLSTDHISTLVWEVSMETGGISLGEDGGRDYWERELESGE